MIPTDVFCGIDFPSLPMEVLLQDQARLEGIPLGGTFELTPRCNFNCRMCYVHLNEAQMQHCGKELSTMQWIHLAEEARDAGMLYLCITGGEPLMYHGFEDFYRAVSQMGFQITLQTNASMITDRIAHLLDDFPPSLAKVTVYGSNDAVYESVCGIKHGFSRADQGIRALHRLQIPVLLVTTVIKQNKDDLSNIAAYANQLGLRWIHTETVYPSLRGADSDMSSVLDSTDYPHFKEDIKKILTFPFRSANDRPCDHCRGRHMTFWITWDGKMRFCSFMNEPNFDVRKSNFLQCWKKLLLFEDSLQWPDECKSCSIQKYCHLCAGKLAAHSGSVHKISPALCNTLKYQLECAGILSDEP